MNAIQNSYEANRRFAKDHLPHIASNPGLYERGMRAGDKDMYRTVAVAFSWAPLEDLKAARDVCVRLIRLLDSHERMALFHRRGEEIQSFWSGVLLEKS